jgi:hypothetical protein
VLLRVRVVGVFLVHAGHSAAGPQPKRRCRVMATGYDKGVKHRGHRAHRGRNTERKTSAQTFELQRLVLGLSMLVLVISSDQNATARSFLS